MVENLFRIISFTANWRWVLLARFWAWNIALKVEEKKALIPTINTPVMAMETMSSTRVKPLLL